MILYLKLKLIDRGLGESEMELPIITTPYWFGGYCI